MDILTEAGFSDVGLYLEGWDDEAEETDGDYQRRSEYLEMSSWVGYLVASK